MHARKHPHTTVLLNRIENRNKKKKRKKKIVISIMQYRDSEGKWVDVLLGEYDKQREKMRQERGRCTDVSQKQI